MSKKYVLTDASKIVEGTTVFRIRALIDIPMYGVKIGDLGGWVESEANLSHDGNCWVADDSVVKNLAGVYQDAIVYDNSIVEDNVLVTGQAQVFSQCRASGDRKIGLADPKEWYRPAPSYTNNNIEA